MLDEPLGALDKKLRQETQFELMDIQEKTGTTFVIVTHDQEEAMTVASRVAVMDHGKIIQVATPDAIYETPNSTYVADFIGDVNLIEGKAAGQDGDKLRISWAEGQPEIVGTPTSEFGNGQSVHFAIRPEKVAISTPRNPRPQMRCRARSWTSPISAISRPITSNFPVDGSSRRRPPTTAGISRRSFTWEDTVWLSWTDTAGVLLER